MIPILETFAAVQALLAVRVYTRMARGARGDRIASPSPGMPPGEAAVTIIVPVLNERARLEPCLAGLLAQGPAVREILIVDGGSTDGTDALVAAYVTRDPRIRALDAAPVPAGWNGKAWGLQTGLDASAADGGWIVTIDADVRPAPGLVAALVAHASRTGLTAFSAAPRQTTGTPVLAALHPALLASLVYRYGIPGGATRDPGRVQANGQCFFVRRSLLVASGAVAAARTSRCEDVTIARSLARGGAAVGFFEAGEFARVTMYESAAECLRNWPRSLLLRDGSTSRRRLALALAEVALVQAAPLGLVLALRLLRRPRGVAYLVNVALAAARLGVLQGMRRAYATPEFWYWLSPLADGIATGALIREMFWPTRTWRGRRLAEERTAP